MYVIHIYTYIDIYIYMYVRMYVCIHCFNFYHSLDNDRSTVETSSLTVDDDDDDYFSIAHIYITAIVGIHILQLENLPPY